MHFVTAAADLLLLAPASLVLIVVLARMGAVGEAIAYAKALAVCIVATFSFKFMLAVCGLGVFGRAVQSPSGHVAFAITFYGSLALLMSARRSAAIRWTVGAGLVALVVAVAASRVVLHMHSRAETIVGAAVGLAALAIFAREKPPHAASDAPLSVGSTLIPLALVFALLAAPLANHWSAEPWIDAMAADFGALTGICR